MRRVLATTMALGLVVTAMGFTGIFAEFTDRATTGTNTAESGTQPKAADLKIAEVEDWSTCASATYTDDLQTGLIDVSDLQPDYDVPQIALVCLKNVGTSALAVTATAIDVVETEIGCTGDEAASGDLTCGTAGVGDGELGTVLNAQVFRFDCATQDSEEMILQTIGALAATPGSLGSLAAGEFMCLRIAATLPGPGGAPHTSEALQQAQSDRVEWRFAFDGAAA
jgi:hypothetical protein